MPFTWLTNGLSIYILLPYLFRRLGIGRLITVNVKLIGNIILQYFSFELMRRDFNIFDEKQKPELSLPPLKDTCFYLQGEVSVSRLARLLTRYRSFLRRQI